MSKQHLLRSARSFFLSTEISEAAPLIFTPTATKATSDPSWSTLPHFGIPINKRCPTVSRRSSGDLPGASSRTSACPQVPLDLSPNWAFSNSVIVGHDNIQNRQWSCWHPTLRRHSETQHQAIKRTTRETDGPSHSDTHLPALGLPLCYPHLEHHSCHCLLL